MILDELVLHDFGVYGGRQSLTLTPVGPDRPIVLVGGLNGGGKTTLLEALQLCLYGSAAPSVGRAQGGYQEHLRRRIHRAPGVRAAGLELAFRHRSDGVEHSYRLVRSWSVVGAACRENFEVLRDGVLDRLATDNWAEQVEEFMPARIASLFLFDGEKVASYADPAEAPTLIGTAVHNLLGLDVVERLSTDLVALERRRRAERPASIEPSEADGVRSRLVGLQERRLELQRLVAEHNDLLDREGRLFRQDDERFRREGGDLYERRTAIEAEVRVAELRDQEAQQAVRDVASGAAPLLLVSDLLAGVRARDLAEGDARRSQASAAMLGDEHEVVLGHPALAGLSDVARLELEQALASRREVHVRNGAREFHLNLPADVRTLLDGLDEEGIAEVERTAAAAVHASGTARLSARRAATALAAVPTVEALADLQASRSARQAEVARLEAARSAFEQDLATVDRDVGALQEREARLAEQEAVDRFRAQDAERILAHSARVRGTLLRFRDAMVARHVGRIERLVLESFRRLVRKSDLVSDLHIDPATFSLALSGADGHEIAPHQLSAGERQLLAVAMLWGMAKASGRPLPAVIDTPLGRLDSEHRSRLVERYFPHASHQVILLSTDEEIAGDYHAVLAPWIGRSYRLTFDADARRTVVEDGYLADGGLRDVA